MGAYAGGVRLSNSNRIIPSDYRILHLLKMPIPSVNIILRENDSNFNGIQCKRRLIMYLCRDR